MYKKISVFLLIILLFTLVGCNKNKSDSEKRLIGFTIFERNTEIGQSQKIDRITDIQNGFYVNEDYSFNTTVGNSFTNVKVDYSKLSGDLLSLDSVCLYVTADYYQAQKINYKLYLYEIYLLNDGGYSIEFKEEIQLSSTLRDTKTINTTFEGIKNELNYVFTYKINFIKTMNPIKTLIREFDENNRLLNELTVNETTTEYVASINASYIIIQEKRSSFDENDKEVPTFRYTLITPETEKKNYKFSMLNENNRLIVVEINFVFPEETPEE